MTSGFQLTLLPGFDGTGELFAPLQAAFGGEIASTSVRYRTERSLDDYVDSVVRVLPQKNAVLVAESFSGPVALSLLDRYPARISCAVLCATFAVSPFRSMARAAKYLPTTVFAPTSIQRSLLSSFCLNGERDDALLDKAEAIIRSVPAATIQSRLELLARVDVTSLISRISTPVLYLQPMRDRIVSHRRSRALTQGFSGITVLQIDGPHLLLQSRPVQCAAAISCFLSGVRAKLQN